MTYKTFGKKIICCVFWVFSLVHVPSAINEEEEYMTLTAAGRQGQSKAFGFTFQDFVSSIFIYSQWRLDFFKIYIFLYKEKYQLGCGPTGPQIRKEINYYNFFLYFCLPSDKDWRPLSVRTSCQIQSANEVRIYSLTVCTCIEKLLKKKWNSYATFICFPFPFLSSVLGFIPITSAYSTFISHFHFLSGLRKSWVTRHALLGITSATPVPFECKCH